MISSVMPAQKVIAVILRIHILKVENVIDLSGTGEENELCSLHRTGLCKETPLQIAHRLALQIFEISQIVPSGTLLAIFASVRLDNTLKFERFFRR